jgi:hypothetical protein
MVAHDIEKLSEWFMFIRLRKKIQEQTYHQVIAVAGQGVM